MKQRHRKHRRPVRDLWSFRLPERLTPMPHIDPMTGHPWALPFHVRWISLDEAKALYPPVDPEAKPA